MWGHKAKILEDQTFLNKIICTTLSLRINGRYVKVAVSTTMWYFLLCVCSALSQELKKNSKVSLCMYRNVEEHFNKHRLPYTIEEILDTETLLNTASE